MPRSTKKSASGAGTIRKKTVTKGGKPYTYWEARFTVGFDPQTGKQLQRSISGKTQKEVAQKLREVTAELDQGSYQEPTKMTLGEWLEIWLKEYSANLKPMTLQTYSEQVKNHIIPELGRIKLKDLKTHMIQRFYNSMTTGEKPLSAKTIKNIHGVLHKALHQAVSNNLIRVNPATACVLPKVQKPEIKPLEPQEIHRVLQEAENDDYRNIFTVALFTGMRQGELLGLSWDCIDFESGVITVKQQLQHKDGKYFLCSPKSNKPRRILPAQLVMDALKAEREKQEHARQQAGEVWNNPFNLVFADASGKNLVRRTVVKHFKAIAGRAGVGDTRFHDMRHSFAVTSLLAGDDVKTVQENLGHATAAFTLDVYGHVTEQMRRDSASRMQRFYESLG